MTSSEASAPYISPERTATILNRLNTTWRHRQGVDRIVAWAAAEENLSNLVGELDGAVFSINRALIYREKVAHEFQNVRSLHAFLRSKRTLLPVLNPQTPYDDTECVLFTKTLASMIPLMVRAEHGQPKPSLAFAVNQELGPRQAAVDGALHFAGRYLARRLGVRPDMELSTRRDSGLYETLSISTLITDTLLEAPLLDGDMRLFTYFYAAQATGLYGAPEHSGRFTPELSAHAAALTQP